MTQILVGDIGGTKTVLALLEVEGERVEVTAERRFVSDVHSDLLPMAQGFLREVVGRKAIAAASFGIAGPVVGDSCRTTNLPWEIHRGVLQEGLCAPVRLLNDFRAVALGLLKLSPNGFVTLQDGVCDPEGPKGVIGAGTGLGEALIVPTRDGPVVVDSEGGHADFAPRNELELSLLRWLWQRVGRVSVERAVSGQGLSALYEFLTSEGHVREDLLIRAEMQHRDRGEVIGEFGLRARDEACARAVEWFVSLYGSEAGNFALKALPTGGLHIAGGIAPKLLPKLQDGTFLRAFLDKGRMASVLARIPVHVVLDPRVGLWGAAHAACELLRLES